MESSGVDSRVESSRQWHLVESSRGVQLSEVSWSGVGSGQVGWCGVGRVVSSRVDSRVESSQGVE